MMGRSGMGWEFGEVLCRTEIHLSLRLYEALVVGYGFEVCCVDASWSAL